MIPVAILILIVGGLLVAVLLHFHTSLRLLRNQVKELGNKQELLADQMADHVIGELDKRIERAPRTRGTPDRDRF